MLTSRTSRTSRAPSPDLDGVSDEQLVERILQGDETLFEILMRRNNTRVYRTVRALLRDEVEAEDAMQAAYVLAYSKLDTFRGGARFSTWLTQIALNEARGRLRHHRRHPSVSLTVLGESAMLGTAASPPTPEAQASHKELSHLIERAVDSLPEAYRLVFFLRDIEGMDTFDTSVALNVSQDVVKTRLSRARASLRRSIEDQVGSAVSEAFGFHASRCDRVVAGVLGRLGLSRTLDW